MKRSSSTLYIIISETIALVLPYEFKETVAWVGGIGNVGIILS
jgi:hypothetical protein